MLRQKLRKYNKDFETELEKYRADPDPLGYVSDVAGDDEEELGPSQVAVVAPSDKKGAKKKDDLDLVSEEEWGSDSDAESSDEEFDMQGKKMEELRRYFLK